MNVVTVPAHAFLPWLEQLVGPMSQTAVCSAAGIKRSTLSQQLRRGRVSVDTVAAITRSRGRSVVDALSSFDAFADLATGLRPPSHQELLSQISDLDLLAEILNRSTASATDGVAVSFTLSPIPHKASVRRWLDSISPGLLRQDLAAHLGIAPQNLSNLISTNRLSTELAVESARLAGVGLSNGLVATGFLSPAEAGWEPGARDAALRRTLDSDLVILASERLEVLGRTLRRLETVSSDTLTTWAEQN